MVYRLLDGPRAKRLVIRSMKIISAITLNIVIFLTCCWNCPGAGEVPAKRDSRIVLKEAPSAEALEQKMLEMSAAGGGILLLPRNSSVTAIVHSVTYKHWPSPHALLVPEHVTLDLNGGTIFLDLRSNSYGIRLTSDSAIQNGTVKLVRSENSGSQRIWHACISVGAAYGDGGTPEKPSYFSKISKWRMEHLTIDQPAPQSAIQIMSESSEGIIRDIRISDSDKAALGVGLDWGTVGPLHMADELQPQMRRLFDEGKVYGTPPHDILIQKIRVGRMTLNENDDGSAAVRTSGCYNITIDDVEVQEAAVGVAVHAGDAGFEYALEPHRHIGHAGYVIKNIVVHKAYRRGVIIDGIADNIYRAILRHGHHSALSTVTPGIDKPLVQHVKAHGVPSSLTGVLIQFSVGAKIEDVEVSGFQRGIHMKDWAKNVAISQCKIHDNETAVVVSGSGGEARAENIEIKKTHIYRNGKNIQAATGQVKEVDNIYRE
jgi:hypothetical protein